MPGPTIERCHAMMQLLHNGQPNTNKHESCNVSFAMLSFHRAEFADIDDASPVPRRKECSSTHLTKTRRQDMLNCKNLVTNVARGLTLALLLLVPAAFAQKQLTLTTNSPAAKETFVQAI